MLLLHAESYATTVVALQRCSAAKGLPALRDANCRQEAGHNCSGRAVILRRVGCPGDSSAGAQVTAYSLEAPALTASAGSQDRVATSNSHNNQYIPGYMPLYPFSHSQPSMLIVGGAGIGEKNSSSPGIRTACAYKASSTVQLRCFRQAP